MMKMMIDMTQIEQIKAEIERKYTEYRQKSKTEQDMSYYLGMADALDIMEQFIDSLSEDKPQDKTCRTCVFYENDCPFVRGKFMPYPNIVCKDYTEEKPSEDLEKAAEWSEDERIRKEIIDWMKGGNTYDWQENKEKWLAYLEKQKEQKPSEDLEKAAEESWADYEYRETPRGLYSSCYVDGFKAGAQWKDAILLPILDRLSEAVLFNWSNTTEIAKEAAILCNKIKED